MNLKPLADRVVVKPEENEEKTTSGIIIPDTAKEKSLTGKVIAVGPGRYSNEGKRIPMDIKKGDTILYGKYAGTEFKMDSEEYLIMNENDILAIMNKQEVN